MVLLAFWEHAVAKDKVVKDVKTHLARNLSGIFPRLPPSALLSDRPLSLPSHIPWYFEFIRVLNILGRENQF